MNGATKVVLVLAAMLLTAFYFSKTGQQDMELLAPINLFDGKATYIDNTRTYSIGGPEWTSIETEHVGNGLKVTKVAEGAYTLIEYWEYVNGGMSLVETEMLTNQ